MREIDVSKITEVVKKLVIDANYYIGKDVSDAIKKAVREESSPTAKEILNIILDNHEISETEKMPICQDTGVAVFFIELGQEVHVTGGDFEESINEGVRQGYEEGYLRKSMVGDPVIERKNTGDNTPAIIHLTIVPGDSIKITVAPKGGGAENMSEVQMMKAADGIEGVKDFVIDRVRRSKGNPCPPVVVGVGIGGDFEKSAILAKKSLLRDIGQRSTDPVMAKVEVELLERINKLGIGPMGLGGKTTALDVFIEYIPCHIASMPVAVNINCHAARHKVIVI